MDEDYLISTKMWPARTLQVFYTCGTPGMSFERGRDPTSVDWKRNCVTKTQDKIWKTPTFYTKQLHIHALPKKKYFSCVVYARGMFRAREICTCWWKIWGKNILKCTGCNGRRLLNIKKNVTRTHSSGILHAWNTWDLISKRARPCICWLKTQLFHIAKRKAMYLLIENLS